MYPLRRIQVSEDKISDVIWELQNTAKTLELTAKAYAVAKILGVRSDSNPVHWSYIADGLSVNVYTNIEDGRPLVEVFKFAGSEPEYLYRAEYDPIDAGYFGQTPHQEKWQIVSFPDDTELYRPGVKENWETALAALYAKACGIHERVAHPSPEVLASRWGLIVQKRSSKVAA